MTIDIDHLRQWIGSTQSVDDEITAFASNALAASLDRDDPQYETGDALPPLWHWMHFLTIDKLAACGPDGHAARGEFLPPVPLPRRMWAGSRFEFRKPLRIGDTVAKTSRVLEVAHKSGRTGDLVFVTVGHNYGENGAYLSEEHDIVYRAAAQPDDPRPTPPQAPDEDDFSRQVTPDPVLLFRYSALTFNSHRIHFDHPYTTGTENYPGLIVHGPLIATLLMDLLRRVQPNETVTSFEFRNFSPLFDTEDFSVHGRQQDAGTFRLWARRADGGIAMDATAKVAT